MADVDALEEGLATRSDGCVPTVQVDREQVVAALGTAGRAMATQLFFFHLLLLVALLNFLEWRREGDRLHARCGGLGPGATPSTNGAAKRLFHARIVDDEAPQSKPCVGSADQCSRRAAIINAHAARIRTLPSPSASSGAPRAETPIAASSVAAASRCSGRPAARSCSTHA